MTRKRNTRSTRSTGAFVLGGVVGGVVGAAVTLWNTPKSGPELRAGFSSPQPTGPSATVVDTTPRGTRFDNPVLSFVERAAAPIVGVDLGKLAKDDAAPTTAAASAPSPATVPARSTTTPVVSTSTPRPTGTITNVADADPEEGQHVATIDELTHPQGDAGVPAALSDSSLRSSTTSDRTSGSRSVGTPPRDPEEGQHVATMEELTRPPADPSPDRS